MGRINLDEAKAIGYRQIYMPWPGIGDNLLLIYAAKLYYKLTGEKRLIGDSKYEGLLEINPNEYDILSGINSTNIYENYQLINDAGIEVYAPAYRTSLMTPFGEIDNICKIHIIGQILSQLGYSGKATISPEFNYKNKHSKFGRLFAKNQIAVMSQGRLHRKTFGADNVQIVVNKLKHLCNFVQIGSTSDQKLNGTLDLRGKLTFHEVAALLHNSDVFLGGIGFLQHLARGVMCRGVITYSNSEPIWAASYPYNVNIVNPNSCSECQYIMIDQKNELKNCTDNFSCIRTIKIDEVYSGVMAALKMDKHDVRNEILDIKMVAPRPLTRINAKVHGVMQKNYWEAGNDKIH
jgi:hypothetical protein